MRLDQKIVVMRRDLSRSRAQDMIKEGLVQVNGQTITKSSYAITEEDEIVIFEADMVFASRAGFKLYDVIDDFQLQLKDRVCLDVGASTGGFSDVCLQQGAQKVYAVDVGKDQLIERLRKDKRVVNMENCNCRYLRKDMFDDAITFACMDVSFISAKLILPAVFSVMSKKELVVLIKPQFEAGKAYVGKHVIVKDAKVHIRVLQEMVDFVKEQGLYVHHLQESSILGRDGNREFVMHICDTYKQQLFDYHTIVMNHKKTR